MAQFTNKQTVQRYTVANPMDEFSFGDQASNLWRTYRDSLSLLKLQKGELRGQFRNEAAAIRQQGRTDLGTAIGSSLERGVLGSSSDVSSRASVRAGTQQGVVGARSALSQGMLANTAQRMSTRNDYRTGMVGLAQQRAAANSLNATTGAFEQALNAIMGQLAGGAGGPGAGGPGRSKTRQDPQNPQQKRLGSQNDTIQQLLQRLGGMSSAPRGVDDREVRMAQVRDRLSGVWGRRNNVLQRMGRDPRAQALLRKRIARAEGQ